MSILDKLISSAAIALDAAARRVDQTSGKRAQQGVDDTFALIKQLRPDLQEQALMRFASVRRAILSAMPNWSAAGVATVVSDLYAEARALDKFDHCNALGFKLAALWLDTYQNESVVAQQTHAALERLGVGIEESLEPQIEAPAEPQIEAPAIEISKTANPAKRKRKPFWEK